MGIVMPTLQLCYGITSVNPERTVGIKYMVTVSTRASSGHTILESGYVFVIFFYHLPLQKLWR